MVAPHGGKLVNRMLEGDAREEWLARIRGWHKLEIDYERVVDVENIAMGIYSPIEGFMCRKEYEAVLKEGRLTDDTVWTIPIVLDVDKDEIRGDNVVLCYKGRVVGVMEVEDVYRYDKEEMAKCVYGTTDVRHPGVERITRMKEYLVGGKVWLINRVETKLARYRLTPKETRVLFELKGWRTVVGFQTRNVPHIGHEYIQKAALTFVDGLFINPVIGRKKKGDFKDEVIISAYEELIRHYYPKDSVVLVTLHMEMRYAGPREAIHHAIIRKNYGCTHIIIGRDHAGVGDFYPPYAAQEIFQKYPDIGITPLFFRSFYYCRKCGTVVNERICPHGDEYRVNFSGTKLRKAFQQGMDDEVRLLVRPEVAKAIQKYKQPFVE